MLRNTQVITKPAYGSGESLDVHHIFPTIQGEGIFAGTPAVFVRLHGCNLQCPECDTDYTSSNNQQRIEAIVQQVQEVTSPSRLVVLSGGEPLRQQIGPLVLMLVKNRFTVQIETNGTCCPPGFEDVALLPDVYVICSPKAGTINKRLHGRIDAFKYVLTAGLVSDEDGLPTRVLDHPAMPRVARPVGYSPTVYVQPADHQDPAKNEANTRAAIDSAMRFGYTLCIQQHKILNLE
ncbi:queuosine biosynthesis radical SAM [Microcystis phage Me-ZS1]|nr:queuosine biosynthesis radical SAM [Microcystis phage Me-ZS1]